MTHGASAGPPEYGALLATPPGYGIVDGDEIPYLPAAAEQQRRNYENRFKDDPELKCYLPGVPRANYMPYPLQIFHSDDHLLIAYQFAGAARIVNLGAPIPSAIDSWMGISNARWDGDTLVVEVSGFNGMAWLDRAGNHSSCRAQGRRAVHVGRSGRHRLLGDARGPANVLSPVDDALSPRAKPEPSAAVDGANHLLRKAVGVQGDGHLLAGAGHGRWRAPQAGAAQRLQLALLRTESARSAPRPPRPPRRGATPSSIDVDTPGPDHSPPSCPQPGAKGGGAPAPGDDDQPLVRRGPRGLFPGPIRSETESSPPGAGCPESEDRRAEDREPGDGQADRRARSTSPRPYENPFGTLLALYLVAKDPERAVMIRLARQGRPRPRHRPAHRHLRKAPPAPLHPLQRPLPRRPAQPPGHAPACGTYSTEIELVPWLDPELTFGRRSAFALSKGIGGGPCPPALAPFTPQAESRHRQPQRRRPSPFYLHLTRTDAEQEIISYSADPAPGPARQDRRRPLLPGGGDRGRR